MFEEYLTVAVEAARAAGRLQLEGLERSLIVETKSSPIDLVTEVDRACEAEIARRLRQAFPPHRLLAEEGSTGGDDPDWGWIVDPLDGTTNYTHRYPFFSTSIGLEYRGECVVGVVYNPVADELFTATAGGGAFLNGQPIRVSATANLGQALLSSGYPGDQIANPQVMGSWTRLSEASRGIRRDGSAALDLCFVACGRIDGFWESLNAWDMAAGSLLVREAGGAVSNFQGEPFELHRREIVASNGLIGQAMVAFLSNDEPKNK